MELSAMRTAVRDRAGVDVHDGMVEDSVITGFINGAIRQVAMMQDWDWNWCEETIYLTAGVKAYDRDLGARKTDLVVNTATGFALNQVTKAVGMRLSARTPSGVPSSWYVQSGKLVVVPTPATDMELTHIFVASEIALEDDTDEPEIPDWAIDIVLVKAAMMVTARTNNTAQHRLLADEERDLVDNLDDEAKRARGSAGITSRRDWGV